MRNCLMSAEQRKIRTEFRNGERNETNEKKKKFLKKNKIGQKALNSARSTDW